MEPTRDVIKDLLPLYLAGEASADSRALVEEHLGRDRDLAELARQWKSQLPGPPPAPVRPDAQALAYQEARRQISNRIITLAAVIAGGVLAVAATALVGAMLMFAR
jgi:predicted anti-sigma-YlaC factor YlaD